MREYGAGTGAGTETDTTEHLIRFRGHGKGKRARGQAGPAGSQGDREQACSRFIQHGPYCCITKAPPSVVPPPKGLRNFLGRDTAQGSCPHFKIEVSSHGAAETHRWFAGGQPDGVLSSKLCQVTMDTSLQPQALQFHMVKFNNGTIFSQEQTWQELGAVGL